VLTGLQRFTDQLLQLTLLLAAALLGRSLPLQVLALLPFAKWAELVRLFMSTSLSGGVPELQLLTDLTARQLKQH